MPKRHPTIRVTTVTVIDPDTAGPVEVEIRKDLTTGAMVGLDGSFLEQLDADTRDPFNAGAVLIVPDTEFKDPVLMKFQDVGIGSYFNFVGGCQCQEFYKTGDLGYRNVRDEADGRGREKIIKDPMTAVWVDAGLPGPQEIPSRPEAAPAVAAGNPRLAVLKAKIVDILDHTGESFLNIDIKDGPDPAVVESCATEIMEAIAQTSTDPKHTQQETVWIIWGEQYSGEYDRWVESGNLAAAKMIFHEHASTYTFDTLAEMNAFLKGVSEGHAYSDWTQIDAPPGVVLGEPTSRRLEEGPGGLHEVSPGPAPDILTLCKHCDHFVEENPDPEKIIRQDATTITLEDGSKLARYVHLEDGEQDFDH